MSIKIAVEDETLVILTVSGKYLFSEFQELGSAFIKLFETHSELSLMVVFEDFLGWEDCDHWSEMTEDDDLPEEVVKKVAIVAEFEWHAQIEMFGLLGLHKWPYAFFLPEHLSEAHQWLKTT